MTSQSALLNLQKFDMDKIGKGSTIYFYGKRNSGKSFLVKDLLFHKRDIPIGTVISGTERANHFYSDIMPKLFIHDEFTPELVSKVRKRQEKIVDVMDKQTSQYGSSNIDPFAFLILDDCLFDNSWVKNKDIRYFFLNGRHLKLTFIITSQYPLGLPPLMRTNLDYIFILRDNYISNRKRLFENFASMFPSFEIFCQVMDQCTENYECLVIDNTTKSNKIEDMVFWYKADEHPHFTIGSPKFWEYHSSNYDENNDEDEEFDPSVLKKKRNTPSLMVKKRL